MKCSLCIVSLQVLVERRLIKVCAKPRSLTSDKDVFREFYMRALAKRLLLGRTASDDFEKNVLAKLERGAFRPLLLLFFRLPRHHLLIHRTRRL